MLCSVVCIAIVVVFAALAIAAARRGSSGGSAVASAADPTGLLIAKHSEVVARFLEIAERKVSILDDYGDENWSVLPNLVAECVAKIAEREGLAKRSTREWVKTIATMDQQPRLLSSKFADGLAIWPLVQAAHRLEWLFREHHERSRANPRQIEDLNAMSGVEFETYVARLLGNRGFVNVRGTPTTGDQGADLLADRAGRLVVIQVKRHKARVGNGAVQEVTAAVRYYGGTEGWVITNSDYTRAARALAQKNGVTLARVEGQSLIVDGVIVDPEVPEPDGPKMPPDSP